MGSMIQKIYTQEIPIQDTEWIGENSMISCFQTD